MCVCHRMYGTMVTVSFGLCHCNCHLKLLCVYCFDQNLGHDKHALKRILFQLYFDDLKFSEPLTTISILSIFRIKIMLENNFQCKSHRKQICVYSLPLLKIISVKLIFHKLPHKF